MSQPPVYVQTPGYSQPIPAEYFQPHQGQAGIYTYGPPPPGTATVIVTQPTGTTVHTYTPVGSTSSRVNCPSCHADVSTTVKYEPSTKTHLVALCLFCFICWPCVCLPYCMDSCQNANHYCPNCNAFIGTYQN